MVRILKDFCHVRRFRILDGVDTSAYNSEGHVTWDYRVGLWGGSTRGIGLFEVF